MPGTLVDLERLHLRVIHVGRAGLWPWWRLESVVRTWTLWCDDRDGASLILRGRSLPLRAGRSWLLPPGQAIRTEPGRDVHQVYLFIEAPGLPPDLAARLAPGPVDLGDDPALAAMAADLHGRVGDEREGAPAGEHDLVAFLTGRAYAFRAFARAIELASAAVRAALDERLALRDPVAPALTRIERDLAQPLYVDALARLCGMGRQWFTTSFVRATGRSPTRYILERRIALAGYRLAHSEESIETIATACGFADRAHFARTFARIHGLPPARFRAEERKRLGR